MNTQNQEAPSSDEGAAVISEQEAASETGAKGSPRWLKKLLVPVGIITGGVATVLLLGMFQQPPEKKAEVAISLGVNTHAVETGTVTFSVDSQGTVMPRTETPLVTEVSGIVEKVSPKLEAGGFFKQGEVLLLLDPSDYEAAVKQAEANLMGKKAQLEQEQAQTQQAEREWQLSGRAKKDAPILALRKPFLDKAKAEVQYAEAELQRAKRKLDRTIIRAPYDGLIKQRTIGLGQYVTVGTVLAEIMAVDFAEVRLPLSDEDIGFLNLPTAQDQSLNLNASATENTDVILEARVGGKITKWPATIVRTEGVIDSRSRVHYAVARIADPYGLIVPNEASQKANQPPLSIGTFVKAKIQGVTMNNVAQIPRDAFRDKDTLMIMDQDGLLRLKDVEVVRADNTHVYVSTGVINGEEVVTTAIAAPVDGMQLHKVDGAAENLVGFRE